MQIQWSIYIYKANYWNCYLLCECTHYYFSVLLLVLSVVALIFCLDHWLVSSNPPPWQACTTRHTGMGRKGSIAMAQPQPWVSYMCYQNTGWWLLPAHSLGRHSHHSSRGWCWWGWELQCRWWWLGPEFSVLVSSTRQRRRAWHPSPEQENQKTIRDYS